MTRIGAMILTGGASSRMGQDKAALIWRGRRAIDRVGALAAAVGAQTVVTVGATVYVLPWVTDDPPLGGPVGGVLSGLVPLRAAGCDRALVLAVDAPTMRPEDIAPLLAHGGPGAAYDDYPLPLIVAIEALPPDARADWPMGRLVERSGLARLVCPPEARLRVRGANTPGERDLLAAELDAYEDAQKGGGA